MINISKQRGKSQTICMHCMKANGHPTISGWALMYNAHQKISRWALVYNGHRENIRIGSNV